MGAGGCATSSRTNFVVALPNGYQIIRGGKAAEADDRETDRRRSRASSRRQVHSRS